eukprot:1832680-Rhodomonas_salina.1
MSGTDNVHVSIGLRACYDMSGTDNVYMGCQGMKQLAAAGLRRRFCPNCCRLWQYCCCLWRHCCRLRWLCCRLWVQYWHLWVQC